MAKRIKKNFVPSLILALFFWTICSLMIFFIEPQAIKNFLIPGSYLIFFLPLSLALFLSAALIFKNSLRGFLAAIGIILFLVLRILKIGNLLNGILILGVIIALELYFSKR